jgi:23S rRNA-/tRNA-specific pseudouridylate synthase
MPCAFRRQNRHALCLAALAPLGFVSELLVVEKRLLPGREHKIRAAVNALQHLIPEFH